MAWFSQLTYARPAKAATPNRLTFVYPYYECPKFFADQFYRWASYPEDLRAHLSIIVVDDGSPTLPAQLEAIIAAQPHFVRVFRIDQDIRWNWLAARNIGAHHAADGWLLLTDMDHVVSEEMLRSVIWSSLDPSVAYMFKRVEHTGTPIRPHSASYLMTRTLFWQIGGYDEALSGYYGTDGEFRRRVAHRATLQILDNATLIRHEFVEDASVTRYKRKQPEDVELQRLIAARPPDWVPKTLSFPYHEVQPCCAS